MKQKNIRLAVLALLSAALLTLLAPAARAAEPGVNLDISAMDNNSATFAVGQKHTWILRAQVPEEPCKSFVLTHVPDSRLTLDTGSPIVILHTADGRQRLLREREHYRLETEQGRDRLRLALTPAGLALAAANPGELRVSFRAAINRTAPMGATIPGTANLTYTDQAGKSHTIQSDRPEVHTGGIHIQVTNGKGRPLEGAVFRLVPMDGEASVKFFDTAAMDGPAVTELTTDHHGRALAYGLPYGNYRLMETDAPTGTHRLTDPIPVTINEGSHLTAADGWKDRQGNVVDNTISIVNAPSSFPQPGRSPAALLAILCAAMLAYSLNFLSPEGNRVKQP